MEILENKAEWEEFYREGWLAHVKATGELNWKLYKHPRNEESPGTPGVDLSQSRLMLISSAGGYLPESQEPFDDASLTGDYSLRSFPSSTPLEAVAYAHDHFDHTRINQDPQVALPLRLLEERVARGRIGSLAPSVASFMGYEPNSAQVVDELVPQVVALAQAEGVEAALLAPV